MGDHNGVERDAYEDTFLEPETKEEEDAKASKSSSLLCPCCLFCCQFCNSWILRKDIRKDLKELNVSNNVAKNREWITQQRKQHEEDFRIETGSLLDLYNSHNHDESRLQTFDDHRQAAGIKRMVPKLKTKNIKKPKNPERQRKDAITLPLDFDDLNMAAKAKFEVSGDLVVSGYDYTPNVISCLVNNDMAGKFKRSGKKRALEIRDSRALSDNDTKEKHNKYSVQNTESSGLLGGIEAMANGTGVMSLIGRSSRAGSVTGTLSRMFTSGSDIASSSHRGSTSSRGSQSTAYSSGRSSAGSDSSGDGDRRSIISSVDHGKGRLTSSKSNGSEIDNVGVDRALMGLSNNILHFLEKDDSHSKRCVDGWIKKFKNQQFKKAGRHTVDRWMAIFYTSSNESLDELVSFCCLLARALLHHYRIVYEERDVAVDYKKELARRMQGENNIVIPYVFAYGIPLGDCRVVYYLHKTDRMKEVLGQYMMPTPEAYAGWMYRLRIVVPDFSINVSLQEYPCLKAVSADKRKIKLRNADDVKKMKEGREFHSKVKSKWRTHNTRALFTDHNYYLFAVNMAACKQAYEIMDSIFWTSLFPTKEYSRDWRFMKQTVDEHFAKKKKLISFNKNKKEKKGRKSSKSSNS